MKIFFTPSVSYLEPHLTGERGHYKIRKFNDGELFLKLEDTVEKQPVTVITATYPPAKHFCELFFLLDTLKQQDAHVHIIFTYFGYGRQDHPKPNVARGAHIIANCFKQFELEKVTIVHPHSLLLQQEITFDRFIPFQPYIPLVKELNIDTIIAPDAGGIAACQELAQQTHCLTGHLEKERTAKDRVIPLVINVPSDMKRVLIFDDIISTGATMVQTATILKEHGATHIYAIATHCFMNELALQKLVDAPLDHIWVSNAVPIHLQSPKLSIINVAPALQTLITNY